MEVAVLKIRVVVVVALHDRYHFSPGSTICSTVAVRLYVSHLCSSIAGVSLIPQTSISIALESYRGLKSQLLFIRRFFGIRECWRNDKEEIVIFRAYRGRDDVLLPEIVVARYGVELKHEIVLIDLCDNCIKLKLKKWENKIWIPSGEVDKLFSFYKFKSVVKIGLMHVTSVIFFVAPVDRRSKPIYMDFYAFHYVKDIVDISLLKLIQDELGLNYFDGLDDVSYGIKDNEMHGNMKSSGVQRIQKNTSNETTIKKRCVAEHHSKRLTEYDMKADRFYICCEFARLLLKSGGLEQWKFTVKGSKITKTFAMHVLKSKGRNREYKIGPKWKDFVKMHKLRPGYLCVFRSDSNKNHLVQVSVVRN
ncbi:hypothetical protein HN51_028308 [Arachis hypogaea]